MANDDFSVEECQRLASALLNKLDERVMELPNSRISYPGPNFCWSDRFWPADGSLPDLGQFVTHESFLVFNMLKTTNEEVRHFLEIPVAEWSEDPDSPNFQRILIALKYLATNIDATNDPAERALKTMKDTIKQYHIEENLQHGLVTVIESRKLAKASKCGQIKKEELKRLIRSIPVLL